MLPIASKPRYCTIIPNPAQQTLNIHLQFAKAQPFTIAVYDATGKLMLEDRMPAASQYTGSIPTQKFPDGNYIVDPQKLLSVSAGKGLFL